MSREIGENANRFIVGIDPGKTTGVGIFDRVYRQLIELHSTHFWGAYDMCAFYENTIALVIVELADTKNVWHDPSGNVKKQLRTGVNVGSVLRESELMINGLIRLELRVARVNPAAKKNAKQFNQLTGWAKGSNQHERDAGLLCYRRNREINAVLCELPVPGGEGVPGGKIG